MTTSPPSSLSEFIETADRLYTEEYSRFVDYANAYKYLVGTSNADPFGKEYFEAVLGQYRDIADVEDYDLFLHESAQMTEAAPVTESLQFPFTTRDTKAIGLYLSGIGLVLQEITAKAGGYIIEYGAGWGHLAVMMAQSGFEVSCIDAEARFVELINARGEIKGLPLKAYQGRFGERPDGDRPVDTVVFMEAFHHALEHLEVVRSIHKMLKPGGDLILAAEPVYENYDFPWGVRPDGHAVWAVRKFKWMELGFDREYFITMLLRCGFAVRATRVEALGPFGLIYRATKWDGDMPVAGTLAPLQDRKTWASFEPTGVQFTSGDSQMTVADLAGYSSITLTLRNYLPIPMEISAEVGGAKAATSLGPDGSTTLTLPITENCGPLSIRSTTARPVDLGVNDDLRMLGVALEAVRYEF